MKWSEQAWKTIEGRYDAILQLPFINELAAGSLGIPKFRFYMMQDSIYLEHFGRALALIGARAHGIQDALAYMRFAENAILVENALHESYFKDFNVTERGDIQPACHHYVHFLRSTAAIDAVEVAMAATLPCFWIYKNVGDHIYQTQRSSNNPYQKWIDTYSGEEFAIAVKSAIDMCDSAAEHTSAAIRKKMTEAFVTSSIMEYHFWEAAYDLKTWG